MKIAVLYGGTSKEREVSMASAAMVAPALRKKGHTVITLDFCPRTLEYDERDLLSSNSVREAQRLEYPATLQRVPVLSLHDSLVNCDMVFLALHGGTGEDGTVQAALDLMNIPYTGSGHIASAVGMDKELSKRLLRFRGSRRLIGH